MSYHSEGLIYLGEHVTYRSSGVCRCGKEFGITDRTIWKYKKRDRSEYYCSYTCWNKYDPDDGVLLIKKKPKRAEAKFAEYGSEDYLRARKYIEQLNPGQRFTREQFWKDLYGKGDFSKQAEKHIQDFLRKQPDIVPEAMTADDKTCFKVVSYRKISETY